MTKEQLHKEIARLESLNDHLTTELSYINELMRLVGFSEGIKTVKATAQEMIKRGPESDEEDNEWPHNK